MSSFHNWIKRLFADELYRAALDGSPEAEFLYGKELFYGINRKKDVDEAIVWIEKAAEQDHVPAEMFMANAYLKGRGVQRNEKKVEYWFEKAYLNGNPEAAYKLASILLEQVNKKYELMQNQLECGDYLDNTELCYEIKDMLDYATDNNVLNALVVKGLLFMNGGVNDEVFPIDFEEGLLLLKRAANKGSKVAAKAIGDAYLNGKGVDVDEVEANLWFNLAENNSLTNSDEENK